MNKTVANGGGYVLSSQVNFALSARITWGDRRLVWSVRSIASRLAQFNTVAAASLVVNEVVFAVVERLSGVPIIAASAAGILCGSLVTFTVNHFVTFGQRGPQRAMSAPSATHLPLDEVQQAATGKTMVFFLPAYREEANLSDVVTELVAYLHAIGLAEFGVVIINDGSPDDTGLVAECLARKHPEVVVCHHEVNRGYGGALTTGLLACVAAKTTTGKPFDLWAFCDADGQFKPDSIGSLLVVQHVTEADLVVGRRQNRESWYRLLLGRAWHLYSSIVVGRRYLQAGDIDCGIKLGRVAALRPIAPRLFGAKAAISPELVARHAMANCHIVEMPVAYYPRLLGKSTGSNPKVMLVSGLQILLVGVALRLERLTGRTIRLAPVPRGGLTIYSGVATATVSSPARLRRPPLRVPAVRPGVAVGVLATVASILAYAVTAAHHAVLLYGDAESHLEIARRMIAGATPGLAQMGGVWPPLPHLLMVPFIWINGMYYSGLAGSLVSMLPFVITTVLVYQITERLTKRRAAGFAAAAVYGLNANMLYMQALPMTESLFFCLMAAAVYCAQQWIDNDRYQWLVAASVCGFLAALTRYEAWPIMAVMALVLADVAWTRRLPALPRQLQWARACDRISVSWFIVGLAPLSWAMWNWAIFGNPFAFQTGQYAQPALWLTSHEPAIGNLWVSAITYLYAVADNVSLPVVLVAAAGCTVLLIDGWRTKQLTRSLPILSALVMLPFFTLTLYTGQRPLHITPLEPDLYNVRFGLILLLPAAVFVGYLTSKVRAKYRSAAVGVVLALMLTVGALSLRQGPITYQEAQGSQSPEVAAVVAAFQRDYTGGLVLMQTFGNEGIAFWVPSQELIYEGSYQLWQPDLRSPSVHDIQWIIARCGSQPDQVCTTVNPGELARYTLVWHSPGKTYEIYKLHWSPPGSRVPQETSA